MGPSRLAPARTELARQIRQRRMTFQEFIEYAERFARENGEVGTLSFRQLQRLAAGRRPDGNPLGPVRPPTARLLEHIFGLSIDELLGPPGGDQSPDVVPAVELERLLEASKRVDASVILLLREQLDAVRRLDRQLGAVVAHDEVKAKVAQVERLRKFSLSPDARSLLGALQSELCTLAGWQALDMGLQAEAWSYYELGKSSAGECHDRAYLIHTIAEQAFVLLEIGKHKDASDLLDSLVPHSSSFDSVLRAWLYAALGEARSADGDRAGSMDAFDTAAEQLSNSEVVGSGPYVVLDQTHLARWRGHALARLGDTEAIEVLTGALDGLDSSFTRAATALRVDLATAYVAQGEWGEARRQADLATAVASEIGSVRQQRRIAAVRRAASAGSR